MTKTQQRLLLGLFGLLLLTVTYCRESAIAATGPGVWAYRLFAAGGLLLMVGSLARLFGKKTMKWALAGLVLAELVLALLFKLSVSGQHLPQPLAKALRYIYSFHCTDYIVYDRQRGRWDEQLFYTLRPGVFEHSNMEFSNKYEVNSMGWRDDEASLQHPELVFLGDSYTMGWGVEQDESFAAVLEKNLGLRGLNTGTASYGTARQYLTLQKTGLDSCRLLVLQFCPNDVRENRAFAAAGYKLTVSPEAVFGKEVNWNKLFRHYYPLKYVHSALYFFVEKWKPKPPVPATYQPAPDGGIRPEEVADFFSILQKIREVYGGPIVVFSLGVGVTQPTVHHQFEAWLAEKPVPGVHLFPAHEHLGEADYLPLDRHLTVAGNQRLAEGLVRFIRDWGLVTGMPSTFPTSKGFKEQ